MSWKHLGTEGFGRLIEANDDLAALLARRCAEADDFEAIPADPELSVVCFRHLPGGRARRAMPPGDLDAHQDRLQPALEVSGDGWLTTTRLRGSTWLRAGIVNYLSTEADIDRLLATLRRRLAAGRSRPRRSRLERLGDLGREATDPGGSFAGERRQDDLGGAGAAVGDGPVERGARGSPSGGMMIWTDRVSVAGSRPIASQAAAQSRRSMKPSRVPPRFEA